LTTFMRSFVSCICTPTIFFSRHMCGRVLSFRYFDKKALVGQPVENYKNGMLFMCIKYQHAKLYFCCCAASLEVDSNSKPMFLFC
jgi:hypothetical protein